MAMDVRVVPQSWLWVPRIKTIRMIEIHATRGNTTPAKQKGAALNWVRSPSNNQGGWGGSFSHVIGVDGSKGTVLDDNQMPTYSAGYGGAGSTYAIDEYAISYELAQSPAQEPFSDAIYTRLAKEVAVDCKRYDIPARMIEIPRQTGIVPAGIVRHDKCENGIKLGKTDPGDQFDEARFITDVKALMEPTPEPEPELESPKEVETMAMYVIKGDVSNEQSIFNPQTGRKRKFTDFAGSALEQRQATARTVTALGQDFVYKEIPQADYDKIPYDG